MIHKSVASFLNSVPPDVRDIVVALREVVRTAVPDAEETMLWGGISYHTPWIGGRVKGALCQISAKRGEVRLEFIHGIRLADPSGLLQGGALSKRHVLIRTASDTKRHDIVSLIQDASAIELDPPV